MDEYRDSVRQATRGFVWTLPRAFGATLLATVAVYLLLVAATPLTLGLGWFQGEVSLRSFQHVQQTYAEAFDDAKAMDALAQNVCVTKGALRLAQQSGDVNTAGQRESQVLAYEGRYNSVRGEYDAYMSDHFRGGVIRPHQLPLPFPTLQTKLRSAGCRP